MSNLNLPNLHITALSRTIERGTTKALAYKTLATHEYDDSVSIRHHHTTIAVIRDYSIWLDTGGWNSTTTANRLNRVLTDNDVPFRVGVKDGMIELRDPESGAHTWFHLLRLEMIAGVWQVFSINGATVYNAVTNTQLIEERGKVFGPEIAKLVTA